MVRLATRKLEGSTLIEVLIAMVIIVVIFTIAMQVFANVMQTGVSFKKLQVQQQLRILAQEVKMGKQVNEEFVIIDSIAYEFELLPLRQVGLSQLHIVALQQGKKISELRCLFSPRDGK